MGEEWGAHAHASGTRFTVRSSATEAWLCLFDAGQETRLPMRRTGEAFTLDAPGVTPGTRYGYRTSHDPAKLLVDPYAVELDRRFAYDPRLRQPGEDTAALVPKAVVPAPVVATPPLPPLFTPGGLIYELNVRGFTMRHPQVPEPLRGTVAALAHPAVIARLQRLRVAAVELMPIVAWIDERHLPPLGLTNAWGYNPVVPMALDPGLCPGGLAELRDTVATLRAAGIGTILDLVFNHSGESDVDGPTLSLRGLDPHGWYARDAQGVLVNDTGTGNTFDFALPHVRDLTLATLRHFAHLGIDGFRFDLAPVMARSPAFDPHAPIFAAIRSDPVLGSRVMIAEPWDIGPDGYRLGQFPDDWLEWNDRYRDDVRRFWRGDGDAGALATRIAGSSDVFSGARSRSVNFVAAHDGFTLADTVAYSDRQNMANGEGNRDGHAGEVAWNGGVEGPTDDPAVHGRRDSDARALLATLFASKGTIMLTAGDEFGRTQDGNNNAYAQDNATTWLDWESRDTALEDFVAALAAFRASAGFANPAFLGASDWRDLDGHPLDATRWSRAQGFELRVPDGDATLILRFDRPAARVTLARARILESRR
ncbi:glycogen debranching protein [Sphingomonas sp.]|uniref:glycogen debranching protein n=1 Tax=Sphingomonas sp. TaxID=28214 RepID=UPI0035BC5F2A